MERSYTVDKSVAIIAAALLPTKTPLEVFVYGNTVCIEKRIYTTSVISQHQGVQYTLCPKCFSHVAFVNFGYHFDRDQVCATSPCAVVAVSSHGEHSI